MDTLSVRTHHGGMTFTLSRFQRRAAPTAKAQQLEAAAPVSAPMTDVFVEVVLPQNQPLPVVPGWTLRLWPQARLGDATLQAHA